MTKKGSEQWYFTVERPLNSAAEEGGDSSFTNEAKVWNTVFSRGRGFRENWISSLSRAQAVSEDTQVIFRADYYFYYY